MGIEDVDVVPPSPENSRDLVGKLWELLAHNFVGAFHNPGHIKIGHPHMKPILLIKNSAVECTGEPVGQYYGMGVVIANAAVNWFSVAPDS